MNELDIEIQDNYEVEKITVEGIADEYKDNIENYCIFFSSEPGNTLYLI